MAINKDFAINLSVLSEVDEQSKQKAFNLIKDYFKRNKIDFNFDFKSGDMDAFFKAFGSNIKVTTREFKDATGAMKKEIQSIVAEVNNGVGKALKLSWDNNGGKNPMITAVESAKSLKDTLESYKKTQREIIDLETQISTGKARNLTIAQRDLEIAKQKAMEDKNVIMRNRQRDSSGNMIGGTFRDEVRRLDADTYAITKDLKGQEYLNLLNKESAQKAQIKSLASDTSRITQNEVEFLKTKLSLTQQDIANKKESIKTSYGSQFTTDIEGKHKEGQAYFNAVEADTEKTAGLQKINELQKDIYNYERLRANLGKNSQTSKEAQKEIEILEREISLLQRKHKLTDDDISKAKTTRLEQLRAQGEAEKTGNIFLRMKSQFASVFSRMVDYSAVFTMLRLASEAGRSAVSTAFELNKAMTDIRMVTNMSKESVSQLTREYSALGRELGATTQEVMASASEWLRQGKTIAETNELIKSSMILSKIGVMDSKDATEKLTSTLNGFNLEAKDSMGIIDAVAKVDMIAATSSNELMTAYQRSASSAQEAGVSFQELTGYIATVSEVTRRSSSTIGESFDFRRL